MNRVAIKPELLRWACERAGYSMVDLEPQFPHLAAWDRGEEQPTLRQAENFARTTHTPIGYLFLPKPPVENMPIPDFRTMENRLVTRLSPDLLDTLYICQQRQDWYRDAFQMLGFSKIATFKELGRTLGWGWHERPAPFGCVEQD